MSVWGAVVDSEWYGVIVVSSETARRAKAGQTQSANRIRVKGVLAPHRSTRKLRRLGGSNVTIWGAWLPGAGEARPLRVALLVLSWRMARLGEEEERVSTDEAPIRSNKSAHADTRSSRKKPDGMGSPTCVWYCMYLE